MENTFKETIQKKEIDKLFNKEINELLKSKYQKSGIKIFYNPWYILLKILFLIFPMNNKLCRNSILKMYFWYKKI
jgi:hypothetical protein